MVLADMRVELHAVAMAAIKQQTLVNAKAEKEMEEEVASKYDMNASLL